MAERVIVQERVDADGAQWVRNADQSPVDAASVTSVNSAATSAQLLAANTARKGVIIENDDPNDLYVKYGATASATSYTAKIAGNGGYWEMPFPIYRGAIDGIWAADGAGAARITEL